MTRTFDVDVLVLANVHDFPTDRVCVELDRLGVRFLRLNSETLPEARIQLDPLAPLMTIGLGDVTGRISGLLRSVWWRQPTFFREVQAGRLPLTEQLIRSQWPPLLRSLTLFSDALWINHPRSTYQAELKAWQLREAASIGFDVPETLMTNDPNAPVERTLGSTVAVKSVDTLFLRDGSAQHFAYTQVLPWAEVANPDLHLAPVTAQRLLSPKLDLRVTVVADSLWCVAIVAGGESIEGDWRIQRKEHLAYPEFDLPREVAARCVSLVKRMDLTYGAIDLALSEGKYYFIEINPTGEWGWLDNEDRPFAKSIAGALARGL